MSQASGEGVSGEGDASIFKRAQMQVTTDLPKLKAFEWLKREEDAGKFAHTVKLELV